MKILAVYAHPRPQSFSRALLDEFIAGATSAGHTVEFIDLQAEKFDPVFRDEEYGQYGEAYEQPADIARYQALIAGADALVFAFPVWWWSMPAILKGWFDRVMSYGFAYGDEPGKPTGLLRDRPVVLLATGVADDKTYAKYRYDDAMKQAIPIGIFGYCGLHDVRWHLLVGNVSEEIRTAHLATARKAGLTL